MAYIGSLDQGTSSTRFMIFDAAGKVVGQHQMEHRQILPQAGYVLLRGGRALSELVESNTIRIGNASFQSGGTVITGIAGLDAGQQPAPAEFGEGFLHQAGGALRPGVEVGPGQRAGEGRVRVQAQPPRGLRGSQRARARVRAPACDRRSARRRASPADLVRARHRPVAAAARSSPASRPHQAGPAAICGRDRGRFDSRRARRGRRR